MSEINCQNINPLSILIIEDNQDDVFLTELAIKECNINSEFSVVKNGEAAIELLESFIHKNKSLPDLIFLDINLPRINGLEVLKNIKSNNITKSIPAIVLTSSDLQSDMKYSYENGADLFIKKPNDINSFKDVVEFIKMKCLITNKQILNF